MPRLWSTRNCVKDWHVPSVITCKHNVQQKSYWTRPRKRSKLADIVGSAQSPICGGTAVAKDSMSTQANPIRTRERLCSVREAPVSQKYAARFLNLHPKTVLRKAREGSLPAHPVGTDRKRWHFYLSELDHWLRSQVISDSHPRRQPQGDYIG
jgi:excisionase family DNA binding protein